MHLAATYDGSTMPHLRRRRGGEASVTWGDRPPSPPMTSRIGHRRRIQWWDPIPGCPRRRLSLWPCPECPGDRGPRRRPAPPSPPPALPRGCLRSPAMPAPWSTWTAPVNLRRRQRHHRLLRVQRFSLHRPMPPLPDAPERRGLRRHQPHRHGPHQLHRVHLHRGRAEQRRHRSRVRPLERGHPQRGWPSPPSIPVGQWLLDEGTGSTILDSSGMGNDGTLSGVTPPGSPASTAHWPSAATVPATTPAGARRRLARPHRRHHHRGLGATRAIRYPVPREEGDPTVVSAATSSRWLLPSSTGKPFFRLNQVPSGNTYRVDATDLVSHRRDHLDAPRGHLRRLQDPAVHQRCL